MEKLYDDWINKIRHKIPKANWVKIEKYKELWNKI